MRNLALDHDLLLNWFHLHMLQLEREKPQLSIAGFSTNTTPPTLAILGSKFIPDGVFVIKQKESSKELLLFLEVDMGSESAASTVRNQNDVRQKVLKYKALFQSEQYRQCEKSETVWIHQ